jgi:hypothetical protein
VKEWTMSIIFAKETMGPSLTSSALGSSQNFAARIWKKLGKAHQNPGS